ncbi:MAG: hypothetical protein WC635_05975 [Bacteriovorax sp.]
MKTILTLLVLFSANTFASSASNKKICDSLYDKAIYNCEVSMCEDWLKDEGTPNTKKNIEQCLNSGDGDLMEGAQICAIDGGELESLIKAYNRKNPRNKINCDDN